MFPLPAKGKEAYFAELSMATDSQLRKRDRENFCDDYSPLRPPSSHTKRNSLDRKSLERTLRNCVRDVRVVTAHYVKLPNDK